MSETEKFIKEECTRVLIELGMPINLQGFRFFRKCIELVCKKPESMKSVTKMVYPVVAMDEGVNGSVVERSMRHASDLAFEKTKYRYINKLFKLSESNKWNYKPSNSETIVLVAEYLRTELDHRGLLEDYVKE